MSCCVSICYIWEHELQRSRVVEVCSAGLLDWLQGDVVHGVSDWAFRTRTLDSNPPASRVNGFDFGGGEGLYNKLQQY